MSLATVFMLLIGMAAGVALSAILIVVVGGSYDREFKRGTHGQAR